MLTRIVSEDAAQLIAGRYRVLAKLGKGYSGAVFEAYDQNLSRTIALKVINPDDFNSDKVLRFQREAKICARLHHPNIVSLIDFNVEERTKSFFLVLELVRGTSLSSLVELNGPFAVVECLLLFEAILKGLAYAHSQGIVHRDLSPGNVLLDSTAQGPPVPKIVDFGLAWRKSDDLRLTKKGAAVGTPAYMSPEQALGKEPETRSDLYSVGCLLFFALTGRPPHVGESIVETIMLHDKEKAPSLAHVKPNENWPKALEELVEKSLCRDPDQRFQSAPEFEEALCALRHKLIDEAARSAAENVKETTVPPAATPVFRDRTKRLLVPLAVLFVCLGAVAIFLSLRADSGQDQIDYMNKVVRESKSPHITDVIYSRKKTSQSGFSELPPFPKFPESSLPKNHAGDRKDSFKGVLKADVSPNAKDAQFFKSFYKTELVMNANGEWLLKNSWDDNGMKLVAGRRDIRILRMRNALDMVGTGLKYLEGIPLIALEIRKSSITDTGLLNLPRINSLRELSLRHDYTLTGTTLGVIAERLPAVTNLDVSWTDLRDEYLSEVCKFKNLENLNFGNCKKLTGVTLNQLAALPGLHTLNLTETKIDAKYLSCLTSFPKLSNLYLNNHSMTPALVESLCAKGNRWTTLSLEYTDLRSEQLKSIVNSCPNLDDLYVQRCPKLTCDSLLGIDKLKSIRALFWAGSRIDMPAIDAICRAKSLEELILIDAQVNVAEAAKLLRKLPKLSKLTLSDPISAAQVASLGARYPKCRVVFVSPGPLRGE